MERHYKYKEIITMTFSQIHNSIKARLPLTIQFLIEMMSYWKRLCVYNASIATNHDKVKMEYTLLRENHIIEKGMSMRDTRHGFGKEKVTALIQRLRTYNKLYGTDDSSFIDYPLSTIKAYIEYQHHDNIDITKIETLFKQLCKEVNISIENLSSPAGIELVQSKDLQQWAKGNFSSLLHSRHSLRYFKEGLPSREQLDTALYLAARTPSACNRQAWHTHIFFNDDVHEILRMQEGCNGFSDDIHCCIVVTADMKGFLGHEPFQCYIDGGLYAQNLINSLHYIGLGTIPLSCGFLNDKLHKIQKKFNIPHNEVLIVIIGVGVMTEQVKIAISTRRPIEATNVYH